MINFNNNNRRGSNNSLTLTINPIKKNLNITRSLNRELNFSELIEISKNNLNLYNEFYVKINYFFFKFLFKLFSYIFQVFTF